MLWPIPHTRGLTFRKQLELIVSLAVLPAGSGPLTGCSAAALGGYGNPQESIALTGTLAISITEAIKRTKAIAAIIFVLSLENCIFLYSPIIFPRDHARCWIYASNFI
jgi:hypothetical protein